MHSSQSSHSTVGHDRNIPIDFSAICDHAAADFVDHAADSAADRAESADADADHAADHAADFADHSSDHSAADHANFAAADHSDSGITSPWDDLLCSSRILATSHATVSFEFPSADGDPGPSSHSTK